MTELRGITAAWPTAAPLHGVANPIIAVESAH